MSDPSGKAATTQDQKALITSQVQTFEGFEDAEKRIVYRSMVAALENLVTWSDEGPTWRKYSGLSWWDTWRNLRNRIDAAMPVGSVEATRQATAAPRSEAKAFATGYVDDVKARFESAIKGIDDFFHNLGFTAETSAQLARGVPLLLVVALGAGLYYRSKGE